MNTVLGYATSETGNTYSLEYYPELKEVAVLGPWPKPGGPHFVPEVERQHTDSEAEARGKLHAWAMCMERSVNWVRND